MALGKLELPKCRALQGKGSRAPRGEAAASGTVKEETKRMSGHCWNLVTAGVDESEILCVLLALVSSSKLSQAFVP